VLELRRHKAAFCKDHLLEHLQNQVRKTIKEFKMLQSGERVLIAVSGGKDSLALWDILLDLGFLAEGLYIDLGIFNYSQTSREKCENFARYKGAKLYVASLPEMYDIGLETIGRGVSRPFCSVCGIIKRYTMNLGAMKKDFPVLATGHNMDDEVSALLGNLLQWKPGYLYRQAPHLPPRQGLVRKIKPLCRLTERETAAYCFIKGIDYILEECPKARGATSITYKEVLNRLEKESPGIKDQFYLGFVRKGRYYFKEEEEIKLNKCSFCGQPTGAPENCSFCGLMDKAGLDPLKITEAFDGKKRG